MKTIKFLTGCFVALTFVTTAHAKEKVEYPEDIRGIYIREDGNCKDLEDKDQQEYFTIISKTQRRKPGEPGGIVVCSPLKVANKNGLYQITESCGFEGEKRKYKNNDSFKREGNTLTTFWESKRGPGYETKFKKCQEMK